MAGHLICTLALCTPNHIRARINPNDYIIGLTSDSLLKRHNLRQPSIAYVMRVDEVLDLDTYYQRYPQKRGRSDGSIQERVGDAIYKKDEHGVLFHVTESNEHLGLEHQDIKGNRVFIGKIFWHFGKKLQDLMDHEWLRLALEAFGRSHRSIRYLYDSDSPQERFWTREHFSDFRAWLDNIPSGLIGMPLDMPDVVPEGNTHPACLTPSSACEVNCSS
ncbi:hypothetical protein ACSSZE_18660 [Acidithiobacillus caldus]